jgi:hypothetical protein
VADDLAGEVVAVLLPIGLRDATQEHRSFRRVVARFEINLRKTGRARWEG